MAIKVFNPIQYGGADRTSYVKSDGEEFTLYEKNWNGSSYSLDVTGFVISHAPQIGLPEISDYPNTRAVVYAALTIPEASGNTVVISAVHVPTKDVKIMIFGLSAAEQEVPE